MGLDIMLYHFSEPKIDTSKKYTLQELHDLGLNSFTIENNDNEQVLNDYLIENFTVEVEIESTCPFLTEIKAPSRVPLAEANCVSCFT